MNEKTKYDGPMPEGWHGGDPVTKRWRGDFLHLYRVTRPCATCGAKISLDVSRRALEGKAKNVGLLLRNCPTCRADRKAGGTGSRGGTSRPVVDGPAPENAHQILETMKAELNAAYDHIRELSARLSKYELQSAIETEAKKFPWA